MVEMAAHFSLSQVNTREFSMLSEVLPKLQTYIVDHCTGCARILLRSCVCISIPVFLSFFYSDILSLPIPEILYCHYSGDEVALVQFSGSSYSKTFQKHDAFVMENLVASGEKPFKGKLFHKILQNMLDTS